MQAMQYEITLPADYDMDIIRHRVSTRGSGTDAFGGLGIKAYLIREKGVNGSTVNQYAPFYLWATAAGMNSFLFGPGFAALSNDFGRPAVQHWGGLAFERGPARDSVPRSAARRTTPVPVDANLDDAISSALEQVQVTAGTEGVHSAALLLDPHRWELVHFTARADTPWADAAADADVVRYEVLHVSSPEFKNLPDGRHW
jgi:Domain of unknown function (DUF4865)